MSATLAACGDDGSSTATPSNNLTTNSNDIDLGFADAGEEPDASVDPDAAEPTVTDAGPEEDAGKDPDSGEDLGPQPIDIEWPATVDAFIDSATYVSYVNALVLPRPDTNGYPTCCRDFGERSKRPGPDNALGSLMQQIINLDPTSGASGLLETSVRDGRVVLLLDHRAFDGEQDPDGYVLSWLDGGWSANTDFAAASDGLGSFVVNRESFIPGSGEPRVVMNPTIVADGASSGGPVTLELDIPIGVALVPVTVHETRIVGHLRKGEGGVGYSEGTLSGYARTPEMFRALNDVVATNCECLGLTADELYTQSATGNWSGSCTPMAHTLCDQPSEEICRVLGGANVIDGGYCGVLPQILQNTSDIDSDGDGEWDSLSLGLKWTAVPAQLE